MSRILPADSNMNLRTQQLLEQFFETHYLPNPAEQDLLRRAGKINQQTLKTWCKLADRLVGSMTNSLPVMNKFSRIRDYDVVEEMLFGDTRLDAAKEVMHEGMLQAIQEDRSALG